MADAGRDDIAVRVAERMVKKSQVLGETRSWEDIGDVPISEEGDTDGYHSSQGGLILRLSVTNDNVQKILGGDIESNDEHYITIEARYGYVDAWLDDMHQIIDQQKLSQELTSTSDFSERDQKIAELQSQIESMLEEVA